MHGRTKKYNLTIHPDVVKKALKDDLILNDVL
jgi:hypothetical protein